MLIEFGGSREEVPDHVGEVYVKFLRRTETYLTGWMSHTPGNKDGLKGPVIKISDTTFYVNVAVPAELHSGGVRAALREEFAKLDDYYQVKDTCDYLCYLAGSQWLRILASKSDLVRWLEKREARFSYLNDPSDHIKVEDSGAARQIRLSWVGRRG